METSASMKSTCWDSTPYSAQRSSDCLPASYRCQAPRMRLFSLLCVAVKLWLRACPILGPGTRRPGTARRHKRSIISTDLVSPNLSLEYSSKDVPNKCFRSRDLSIHVKPLKVSLTDVSVWFQRHTRQSASVTSEVAQKL